MDNSDFSKEIIEENTSKDEQNKTIGKIQETLSGSKKMPYIHYCQYTSSGCGVASFLMALSGIKKGYIPDTKDEIDLVNSLEHNRLGISLSSIMKLIESHGIKMNVFYGNNINNLDQNNSIVKNYKNTIESLLHEEKINYQEDSKINIGLIISEIEKGRYVIIHGTIGGMTHIRMIMGYEGNKLLVADPLYEQILKYDTNDFEENFNPPYGKRFTSLYI